MTDEMLAWQTERFTELAVSPATVRDSYVVEVRPLQVVEIAFDGLQRSTRYPGGVAAAEQPGRLLAVVHVPAHDDPTAAVLLAGGVDAATAAHVAGVGDPDHQPGLARHDRRAGVTAADRAAVAGRQPDRAPPVPRTLVEAVRRPGGRAGTLLGPVAGRDPDPLAARRSLGGQGQRGGTASGQVGVRLAQREQGDVGAVHRGVLQPHGPRLERDPPLTVEEIDPGPALLAHQHLAGAEERLAHAVAVGEDDGAVGVEGSGPPHDRPGATGQPCRPCEAPLAGRSGGTDGREHRNEDRSQDRHDKRRARHGEGTTDGSDQHPGIEPHRSPGDDLPRLTGMSTESTSANAPARGGTAATRRRRREAEIISATRRLFDERGVRDAQIEDIARAVGINRAIIYRHFTGKEELFSLTLVQYLDELRVALEQAAADTDEPRDQLVRLVEAFVDYGLAHPAFVDCAQAIMRRPGGDLLEEVSESAMYRLGQAISGCLSVL